MQSVDHGPAGALYRQLAFDHYALQHWDYDRPIKQDAQQWEKLVRQYWCLVPVERLPYHSLAMALEEMQPGDPALKLPDAAQPSRVLAPFQTSQERAVSLKPRRVNPILVLTCYEPDLEEAWSQLAGMGHDNISAELDNSDLYNVGDEWPKVLIRIPDIVDTIRGGVPEDYDNRIPEDGDLIPASPQYASNHEVALLYVVDQKALREGLVQVKWLDWKAELVWENKIARDYMHPIRGLFHEGFSLYEILGADDEAERGALLCE